ncbi:hypothetical protein M0813_21393 [Anaeramoeba flamelloides]|uniref:Uncharacterized protein n=1 Tax=Anaeramoeba flamelloides TaxID=1746091 RepID=A0ABQ8YHQ4_9EUKA|nr:hypothetical protein M0813_21393 [Anaeramoeba flamelloides]
MKNQISFNNQMKNGINIGAKPPKRKGNRANRDSYVANEQETECYNKCKLEQKKALDRIKKMKLNKQRFLEIEKYFSEYITQTKNKINITLNADLINVLCYGLGQGRSNVRKNIGNYFIKSGYLNVTPIEHKGMVFNKAMPGRSYGRHPVNGRKRATPKIKENNFQNTSMMIVQDCLEKKKQKKKKILKFQGQKTRIQQDTKLTKTKQITKGSKSKSGIKSTIKKGKLKGNKKVKEKKIKKKKNNICKKYCASIKLIKTEKKITNLTKKVEPKGVALNTFLLRDQNTKTKRKLLNNSAFIPKSNILKKRRRNQKKIVNSQAKKEIPKLTPIVKNQKGNSEGNSKLRYISHKIEKTTKKNEMPHKNKFSNTLIINRFSNNNDPRGTGKVNNNKDESVPYAKMILFNLYKKLDLQNSMKLLDSIENQARENQNYDLLAIVNQNRVLPKETNRR